MATRPFNINWNFIHLIHEWRGGSHEHGPGTHIRHSNITMKEQEVPACVVEVIIHFIFNESINSNEILKRFQADVTVTTLSKTTSVRLGPEVTKWL